MNKNKVKNSNSKSSRYSILFTDIQLHAVEHRNSKRWLKKLDQASKSGIPSRIYGTIQPRANGKIRFSFPLPPKGEWPAGLKILVPKKGLDVKLSKDAIQYIDAHQSGKKLDQK